MLPNSANSVLDSRSSSTRPVNKLLATLPPDDYERVSSQLSIAPLMFKQVLYRQGEVIQQVFFPGGGACSLTRVMRNGQIAEIATIGSEGVIGASVFFGDDQSFSETIVQVADGDGLRMPVDAFVTEMSRRGAFYNRIIRYSQALMSQVMQTTVCNGLHSVEQRCCRWLLMTCDRVGTDDLRLTHEFLAIMLGVRRPTVTLVMGDLQKAGLVDNRRGTIHVVDRGRLEMATCECYAAVKANFARLLPEMAPVS
jgi:CRP-like cAMP-binding protein